MGCRDGLPDDSNNTTTAEAGTSSLRWPWLRRALLLLPILGGCVAVTACTTSTVRTEYYDVSGESAEQLDRELAKKGPMGGKANASAEIRFIPVGIRFERRNGLCRYRTLTLRVAANITLPRWQEEAYSKNADLRRKWKSVDAYLRWHEQKHVEIAEAFAERVADLILKLPPQETCQTFDRLASAVFAKARPVHERAQKKFDAEMRRVLSS